MTIIKNNLIAFGIHIGMLFVFLIGLFAFVSLSPYYRSEIIAWMILIIAYLLMYFIYIKLNMKLLYMPEKNDQDYFSGILIAVISTAIWWYTMSLIGYDFTEKSRDNEEYWIINNMFNFMLWPFYLGSKYPIVFLSIGLLNGMFPPLALKLKRWKEC
jgi:hypothetical protein